MNAPWTFSARCVRLRPTWLWVALTLRSAPTSQGLPLARAISRASMAAWLKRRRQSLDGMERHGRETVGVGEDVGARPRHPARDRPRKLGAVGIFQPVDELARRAVLEPGDGAGAGEDRRIGHRLRRQETLAEVLLERRAEALAIGPFDEPHRAPAARAERAMRVGRRAAGEAGRRIEGIDRAFRQHERAIERAPAPAGRGGFVRGKGEIRMHGRRLARTGALRDVAGRRIRTDDAALFAAADLRPRAGHRRLDRAWARAGADPGADFLLRRAAEDLVDRVGVVKRRFALAADLGAPGPHGAAALAACGQVDGVVRLAPTLASLGAGDFLRAVGDVERLPLADGRFDLAVSLLALQTVNDLPGALIQMRRALAPDGLAVVALLGGDTLTELRQSLTLAESEILGGAAPRVAPFVELRALGALAQRAGLALPVVDLDRVAVRYADIFGADGRPARLRRRQRPRRPQPQAAQARGSDAGGGGLRGGVRRPGRPVARDVRHPLAQRLGAA